MYNQTTIAVKNNHGYRLDIRHLHWSDSVSIHGFTYSAVRICAQLKYIFWFSYLGRHWRLIVIGWIFAYICLEPSARLNIYEYEDHMHYVFLCVCVFFFFNLNNSHFKLPLIRGQMILIVKSIRVYTWCVWKKVN